mmetsp:Transcript_64798/g.198171  ORF Transcript_64798/g.198171 Transcript_64798/m.198171 type:complete len:205 (-) Transcript_64798:44-658(-)
MQLDARSVLGRHANLPEIPMPPPALIQAAARVRLEPGSVRECLPKFIVLGIPAGAGLRSRRVLMEEITNMPVAASWVRGVVAKNASPRREMQVVAVAVAVAIPGILRANSLHEAPVRRVQVRRGALASLELAFEDAFERMRRHPGRSRTAQTRKLRGRSRTVEVCERLLRRRRTRRPHRARAADVLAMVALCAQRGTAGRHWGV